MTNIRYVSHLVRGEEVEVVGWVGDHISLRGRVIGIGLVSESEQRGISSQISHIFTVIIVFCLLACTVHC